MGETIWVDVEGRAEDELPSDNSIIPRLEKQLDKLSARLGVAKLTDFYDYSEVAAEFGDSGWETDIEDDESADRSDFPGTWFDPTPALHAVSAIRRYLSEHPGDLNFKPDASTSQWPTYLMDELAHVQSVLEDAAARGKNFRFLIVG